MSRGDHAGMVTTGWTDARISAGDEVILPGFGGLDAAERVRELGAVPVVVDIDPLTFCIDPGAVEAAVTERTTAVVAVHLFGHPADLVRLENLSVRQRLRLVQPAPLLPDPTEPAPLGTAYRRRNAAYLDARLTGVSVPFTAPGARHTYRSYVVRVPGNGRPDRDAFKHALRARGVDCHVPVRTPVHRTPGFRSEVRLPESERAADECLGLPVEPSLTRRELHRVVSACNGLGGLLLERAC